MSRTVDVRRKVVKDREPLTRDRILAAAVELADAEGLVALSMRRLAGRLGVEAMSLYHHVRNKDDLLAGALGQILEDIEVPPAGTPWKAALRALSLSAHAVLGRHRWAASVMMSTVGGSEARYRWMEASLDAIGRAGLPRGLADHAYHALDSLVIGFTLWQSSIPFSAHEIDDMARRFLETVDLEARPRFAEHVRWHIEAPSSQAGSAFEAGLDFFLDGLELAAADPTAD